MEGIIMAKRTARELVAESGIAGAGGSRLTVGSAVLAVLSGLSLQAQADQKDNSGTGTLEEITVTATRRTLTPEEVPYSISVISGDVLARANVVDIESLALQV